MYNDRPVNDPRLQAALNDCKRVLKRYGFAGAFMLVAPKEAAYFYGMHAPWSAIRQDDSAPMGWRLRAIEAQTGKELTRSRIEAAVHTICQLSDFGSQTMDWMEQLKQVVRNAGIDFDHTAFGGKPLPSIVTAQGPGTGRQFGGIV